MNTNTMLWIGGGLGAAYLLFNKTGSAAAVLSPTGTNSALLPNGVSYPYIVPGAPAMPGAYNDAYYKAYVYPAMVAANTNITNAGYNLTDEEANQYLANYLDVAQWANTPSTLSSKQAGGTVQGAARYHWHNYGPQQKRTFLPLPWADLSQYVPAPKSAGSSGGGTNWLSTLTTVATVAASFAGTEAPRLNDTEVAVLMNGSAILKNILPLYYNVDRPLVEKIDKKLISVLTEYI